MEKPPSLEDIVRDRAKAAHSIFAPSSSYMWLTCLGSLIPNVLAPDEQSFEAAEGTVAHSIADTWLRSGVRPDHMVGSVQQEGEHWITITEAMLAYIQQYVEWVMELEGEHHFERRYDLSELFPIPGQGGTADSCCLSWNDLTITDLKYGTGVKVDAAYIDRSDPRFMIDGRLNGHPQTMLYAVGVFLEWDWFYHFEKITIRICQPRIDHFDVWETTREQLLAFMEYVKQRAPLAWQHNAPRTPDPKACQWCRVQKDCPAKLAWLRDRVSAKFDLAEYDSETMQAVAVEAENMGELDLLFEPVPIDSLSVEAKGEILRYRSTIEAWFSAIAADLLERAKREEPVKHWKLGQGRQSRDWVDEQDAAKALRKLGLKDEQIYTTSIVSPNQAEEALHGALKMPKKKAAGLIKSEIVVSPGPRSLIPDNDRRAAANDICERFN